MYSYNKIKNYRKVEAGAASQLEQVAILLEHCAKLAGQAKYAVKEQLFEERFLATEKMITILSNMQSAFDVERSEHGRRMISFLQNIVLNLAGVNINNDAELCDKIQAALLDMAQAWRLADIRNRELEVQGAVASPGFEATATSLSA